MVTIRPSHQQESLIFNISRPSPDLCQTGGSRAVACVKSPSPRPVDISDGLSLRHRTFVDLPRAVRFW